MLGADLYWGRVFCEEPTLLRRPFVWVRALHGVVSTNTQEQSWCIQSGGTLRDLPRDDATTR